MRLCRREPLGRSMIRGHVLPEGLGSALPFGITDNIRDYEKRAETKTLLFPSKDAAEAYHGETPARHPPAEALLLPRNPGSP